MARWRAAIGAERRESSESGPRFVPGFTPGKAGPVSEDPRHNRAFPHPENPGLFVEPDGFYDWANRRLYLSDGSPDPMTPGAYRYQTRPDLCDLDAPDSDPSSPRYEPDHLRHKPGDTWLIDRERPYDVLDPGPFGSPGWFPDRRTGRHRRDELPDPIPWWEAEEDPEKAEWAEHAEALWDRRTRSTRVREAPDRDDERGRGGGRRAPETDRWRPETPERPSPSPRHREPGRPWGSQPPEHNPPRGPRTTPQPNESPGDGPHLFTKLQEDAWERFMIKSGELAAAHLSNATAHEFGPVAGRIARGLRRLAGLLGMRATTSEPISVPAGVVPGRPEAVPDAVEPVWGRPEAIPKPDTLAARRHATAAARSREAITMRTSRFAQAVRGAQRARLAQRAPAVVPPQVGPRTRPQGRRPHPRPQEGPRERLASTNGSGPFIAEWERHFETRLHLHGGAAWA